MAGELQDIIKNGIVTFFLLVALLHAFSYATVYMMTVFNVLLTGEKSRRRQFQTRMTAMFFIFFYISYNVVVYTLVLQIINWENLFTGSPWAGSIFDQDWAIFMFYEPVVLILTSWFKIGCAADSWRRSPSKKQVVQALNRQAKKTKADGTGGLPFVTIVMPIYNEPMPSLMCAIDSVVMTKYPKRRMHLVMAFDDDGVTPLYRAVMYALTADPNKKVVYEGLEDEKRLDKLGVSRNPRDYPVIGDLVYKGLKVTPCRFIHGGKRHAQMKAYEYLDAKWSSSVEKPLLLFIDSDIELNRYAINYFVYDLNRHAGLHREALTGLITCKTAGTYSFIKVMQDTEYIESQMLQRNTEDYLGSVSCLPGALTMVRFESLKSVAKIYFSQMEATDNVDFARCHLGEDRYLTHLLMEARPEKHRIGFCAAARCKTEACETMKSLLKQRRRWYLGTMTNEIFMLTSPVIWRQFPALNLMISLSALKNGPLFVYVFISEALLGRGTNLTIGFAVLIFGPIWLFVAAYSVSINRKKVIWCYPLILLMLPVLASSFQIYGMMTMRVRSWGGPRADVTAETDEVGEVASDKVPSGQQNRKKSDPKQVELKQDKDVAQAV